MFYIKQFFKMILSSGPKGALFLFITSLFFAITFLPENIRNQALGQTQDVSNNSVFFVMTDAKLTQSFITNKMNRLASVKKVSFFTKTELQDRVDRISEEMGVQNIISVDEQQGFKVFLKKKTPLDKVALIKQYIQRLSPSSEFIFSNIEKRPDALGYIAKYSSLIILFGLSVTWILLAVLVVKPIKKRAYIMEKFQRKNWVAAKVVGSGMFLFLAANALGQVYLKQSFLPALVTSSVLFFLFTLSMMKSNKWQA